MPINESGVQWFNTTPDKVLGLNGYDTPDGQSLTDRWSLMGKLWEIGDPFPTPGKTVEQLSAEGYVGVTVYPPVGD